jgi:hypothetical protein
MTINFYSKEVYGNTLYYLANPFDARRFKQLTGKLTISENDMRVLEHLTGVTFTRVFGAEL